MSLRFILFKKFGFRIGTVNSGLSFFIFKLSAPKWTKLDRIETK